MVYMCERELGGQRRLSGGDIWAETWKGRRPPWKHLEKGMSGGEWQEACVVTACVVEGCRGRRREVRRELGPECLGVSEL